MEKTILHHLIWNEEYSRRVLPFIKEEYFQDNIEKILFKTILEYADKYKSLPAVEALGIELQKKTVTEDEFKKVNEYLEDLHSHIQKIDDQWLLDETEKWCKDKAIYNAILNGIHIIDGKDKQRTPEALPTLLSDALAVSFDTHVGHDYLQQSDDRYEFYHTKEEKIPFDLDFFNKITKGGLPNKTLNICLAGTGVGKSMFMVHVAANCLMQGKNVLYITLEMSENRIAERVDANLMNITMDDMRDLPRHMYENKFERIAKKTQGQLIVKEYPTASAHCGHFRALLNELALKKTFRPDIIFIDYLNICASSRFRHGAVVNLPIMSATQTTRTGFVSSDIGLEDTSESFGLPATADFMFALISSDELQELNQMLVKQLKNRYADPTYNKKFILGVDRAKMKLYDVSQTAQDDVVDTGQEEEIIDRFADFKV